MDNNDETSIEMSLTEMQEEIIFYNGCLSLFGDIFPNEPYFSRLDGDDKLIFQSFQKPEDTELNDFELSCILGDEVATIIIFSLEERGGRLKIIIKSWNKELIKSICNHLDKAILEDINVKNSESLEDDKDNKSDGGDGVYFRLYAHVIFPLAIKSGDDYFVEYIIDKCINLYNEHYENELSPKILNIITTSFPKLHDLYPDYAKKFISTLTVYRTSDLMISSDKHLQSYNHIKSQSYEDLQNDPKLRKEFPHHKISPYIVTVIVHLILFCVNVRGSIVALIIMGGSMLSVLSLSGLHNLIPKEKRKNIHKKRKELGETIKEARRTLRIKFETTFGRFRSFNNEHKRLSVRLFVPFPKLVTYDDKTKNVKKSISPLRYIKQLLCIPDANDFVKNHFDHWERSFNLYSEWNGEALINFKWDHFGKYYYYWYWHTFNIFQFFSVLMIYPSYPKTLPVCVINIVLGAFLLSFEVRKFLFRPISYLLNPMNHLNLGSYGFPIWTSIYFFLYRTSPPAWVLATSLLLLHAKAMSFLRSIEFFERYLVIILCVARRIFSFVIILILVALAYADAFWIFLRSEPTNSTDQNFFKLYETSAMAIHHIVMGDYDSLKLWGFDNPGVMALWGSFTFIVVIYLLNLFIGLLSMAIEEKDKREYILMHKAETIFEIELFWLLPQHKQRKDWFPDYIWYNVPIKVLREKVNHIGKSKDLYKGYKPIIHNRLLELVKPPS